MKKIRILSIILAIVLLMTSIRTDWWERADALTSQETSAIAEESVLSEAAMLDAPAVDADQPASESNEAEPESSADQDEATVDSALTITEAAGEENTTNAENGQQEETGDTQNTSQTAGGTAASSAGENADTSFTEGITDSASSPEAAESATESEDPAENEEAVLTWQTLTVEAETAALQDEWNNPTEPVTWMNSLWQWLFARDAEAETFADRKWKLFGRNKLAPVTLTISGYLPEGVTAEATYIQFAEPDIYSETALLDFDLSLYDAEGNLYIPTTDQPFTIQINGRIVDTAAEAEKDFLVYAQTEDTRDEETMKALLKDQPEDTFTASMLVYRTSIDEDAYRNYTTEPTADEESYVLFSEVKYTDIEQQKSEQPIKFTKEDEKKGTLNTQKDNQTKETSVIFEAGTLPLRFVLSAQQAQRSLETKTDDGQTEVSVQGALSENMTVEAETVEKADGSADDNTQSASDNAKGNNPENTVADAVDGELIGAWDISLSHKEEGDCQPDAPVTVTITDDAIGDALEDGAKLTVWSISEEGETVQVEGAESQGNSVEFQAESLATFAVTYTVDFHWGEYTYNMEGGSEIYLSSLLTILGNSDSENLNQDSARLLALASDMEQIENVTFSNTELLKVEKKNSKQSENDWLLTSLAAFNTEEMLTITLTDGEEIVVRVTDARPVTVDVPVTKVLTSNSDLSESASALEGETFGFHATVSPADGASFEDSEDIEIPASTVLAEAGTTSKSYTKDDAWKVTFSKPGTYTVTVSEVAGDATGVEYASEPRTLTYRVVEEEGVLRVVQEESAETTAPTLPEQYDFPVENLFNVSSNPAQSNNHQNISVTKSGNTIELETSTDNSTAVYSAITTNFSFDFSRSFELSGKLTMLQEDGFAFAFESKTKIGVQAREGGYGLDMHNFNTAADGREIIDYFKTGSTTNKVTTGHKGKITNSDMEKGFLFIVQNEPISGMASFTMNGKQERITYAPTNDGFRSAYNSSTYRNKEIGTNYVIIGSGDMVVSTAGKKASQKRIDEGTAWDFNNETDYSIRFDCTDYVNGKGKLTIIILGQTIEYADFDAKAILGDAWQEAYFVIGACEDNIAKSKVSINDFHYTDGIDTNAVNNITTFWADRDGDGKFETEVNTTDSPAIKGETILVRHDLAPSNASGYDHDFYIKALITQLKSETGNNLNPREPVARSADGTRTGTVKDFTNSAFNLIATNGKYDASKLAEGMYVPILKGASHTIFEYKITAPDTNNCKVWESALFGEPPFPTLKTNTYGFRTEKGQTWSASFTNTANVCNVTYNPNGGTFSDGTTANKVISNLSGTTILVSENPTRSGYVFADWKLDNSTTYNVGDTFTLTGNMTLTAQWVEPLAVKIHVQEINNNGTLTDRNEWLIDGEAATLEVGGEITEAQLIDAAINKIRSDATFDVYGTQYPVKDNMSHFYVYGKNNGAAIDVTEKLTVNRNTLYIDGTAVLDNNEVWLVLAKGVPIKVVSTDNSTSWNEIPNSRGLYWQEYFVSNDIDNESLELNSVGAVPTFVGNYESWRGYASGNIYTNPSTNKQYRYGYAVLNNNGSIIRSIKKVKLTATTFKWQYQLTSDKVDTWTDLGDSFVTLRYNPYPVEVPVYWVYEHTVNGKKVLTVIPDTNEDRNWYGNKQTMNDAIEIREGVSQITTTSGVFWAPPYLGTSNWGNSQPDGYPFEVYDNGERKEGFWAKYEFAYFAVGARNAEDADALTHYADATAMYLKTSPEGIIFSGKEDFSNSQTDFTAGLYIVYNGEAKSNYICKIGTERFETLRAAVQYAQDHNLTTATIEMLVDYTMPSDDTVTIPAGYDITFTTASKTGDAGYVYTGASDKATITRGFTPENAATISSSVGNQLFIVTGAQAKLTFTDIVIDGAKATQSGGKGSLVYVNGDASNSGTNVPAVVVGNGATLQNAKSTLGGGAIYVDHGTATVAAGGTIKDCEAAGDKINGGAIYAESTGAVINISGTLSGNSAADGGAIKTSTGAIININPGASLTGNHATNGGAIYTGGTVNMSGGSITGNTADAKGAGICADKKGSANFSGAPVVYDNKVGGNQRNLEFSGDNNTSVNLTAALGDDAHIGIYAPNNHNKAGEAFGTRGTIEDNLNKFTNDRNDQLYGVKVGSDGLIYWVEFVARVSNDNGATWTYHQYLINNEQEVQGDKTIRKGAFDEAKPMTGDVIIETLLENHARYMVKSGVTFSNPNTTIILRTTQDATWNKDGFTSTLTLGYDGNMLQVGGKDTKFITSDIIFEGDRENRQGRAIYVTNGSVEVQGGSTFRNFNTNDRGAAIHSVTTVVIKNTGNKDIIFTNCEASKEGGAIRTNASGAGVTITNSGSGNVTFTNCKGSWGGAIETESNNSPVTINNTGTGLVKFKTCEGSSNGGAIATYGSGSYVSIVNEGTIEFEGCISKGSGGAIYSANTVSVSNHNDGTIGFKNCTASSSGGGIYASGAVMVNGTSSFTNCTASSSGGAIYAGGAVMVNGTSRFTNCTASSYGGAIYAEKNTEIKGKDDSHRVIFENCQAIAYYGGAIRQNSGDKMTLSYVTFGGYKTDDEGIVLTDANGNKLVDSEKSCHALNYGGAVEYEENSGLVEMSHCRFIGCYTTGKNGHGGAIYAGDGTAHINCSDSEFIGCYSSMNGGAVYTSGNDANPSSFTSTVFEDCYAKSNGGSIYLNAKGTLENVLIDGHKRFDTAIVNAVNGGGIYAANTLTMSGINSFSNCTASTNGGGAYFASTLITDTGSSLKYDTCYAGSNGGGAYFKTAESADNLKGSLAFEDCYSTDGNGGGAYFSSTVDTTGATAVTFTGCHAGSANMSNGGGGAWFNGAATLGNTTKFENCFARTNGGGAYFYADSAETLTGVTFTDCKAGWSWNEEEAQYDSVTGGNGGALYKRDNNLTMSGCVLTGCYASGNGGAVYYAPTDTLTLNNATSITGCTVGENGRGTAIYIDSSGKVNFNGGTETTAGVSITGNRGAGAVEVNNNGAVLTFDGNVKIENNYDNLTSGEGITDVQKNVVLDRDKNTVIKTSTSGLTSDAHIGIYVIDTQADKHGVINMPFGTWADANGKNNLDCFTNDRNEALFGMSHGDNDKLIYWGGIICKIEDSNAAGGYKANGRDVYEHPFPSLNAALTYAREKLNGSATIQMLTDYPVPEFDVLKLTQETDDIAITTAATEGVVYCFKAVPDSPGRVSTDSESIAILARSWNGYTTADEALFCLNNASAKLTTGNIVLDGRAGTYQGRAVYVDNGSLAANGNTTYRNHNNSGNGGAIYAVNDFTLTAEGTINFDNCAAENGGGIYAAKNISVTAEKNNGVTFTRCITSTNGTDVNGENGGAIYQKDGNKLVLNNVTFGDENDGDMGCKAAYGGGAVFTYLEGSSAEHGIFVSNCNFFDCVTTAGISEDYGGGALVQKGNHNNDKWKIEIKNSSFTRCSSATGSEQWGGAVALFANNVNAIVDQCKFEDCHGQDGGAIESDCPMTVSNTSFTNCYAAGIGGAVCFYNSGTLENVTIDGGSNSLPTGVTANAKSGGAVYTKGNLTMKGGSISGVVTASGSGAVDIESSSVKLTFSDSARVTGNKDNTGADSNVYLGHDSYTIINADALGDNALIGIRVADSIFAKRGESGMVFGSYTGEAVNLNHFVNDVRGYFGEMEGSDKVKWEYIPVPMVPVTVEKIWAGDIDESDKKSVPFTIYGISEETKYRVSAYDAEDVTASTTREVTELTAADGWAKTVYVPSYILQGGSEIDFDGNYTIEENTTNFSTGVWNAPEITVFPEEVTPGEVITAGTVTEVPIDTYESYPYTYYVEFNTNKTGGYYSSYPTIRNLEIKLTHRNSPEDSYILHLDVAGGSVPTEATYKYYVEFKSPVKYIANYNVEYLKINETDNLANNIRLISKKQQSQMNFYRFVKTTLTTIQYTSSEDYENPGKIEPMTLRMTNSLKNVKLQPIVIHKDWASTAPADQVAANSSVSFTVKGIIGDDSYDVTAYAANTIKSAAVTELKKADKLNVGGTEKDWTRLVYVPVENESGSKFTSYEIVENTESLTVLNDAGVWDGVSAYAADAKWVTNNENTNVKTVYLRVKVNNIGSSDGYSNIDRFELYYKDADGRYYHSTARFASTTFVVGKTYYLPVPIPVNVDQTKLDLLIKYNDQNTHIFYTDNVLTEADTYNGILVYRGNDRTAVPKFIQEGKKDPKPDSRPTFEDVGFVDTVPSGATAVNTAEGSQLQVYTTEKLTVTNNWYICKIVDSDGVEHGFPTLRAALTWARNNNAKAYVDGNCSIQMLVDYTMPDSDSLTGTYAIGVSSANENITITTASTTAGKLKFKPSANRSEEDKASGMVNKAIIKRGFGGECLLALNDGNGTLTVTNLILDGDKVTYTRNGYGGLIWADGTLNITTGAILRNAKSDLQGGAVHLDKGTMTIDGDAKILNNEAQNGGGIHFGDKGTTVTIQGNVLIEGNKASNYGGGVFCRGKNTSISGNVIIRNNDAGSHGGGINIGWGGELNISGTNIQISGNNTQYGAGINIENSNNGANTLSIGTGVTISDNNASKNGGGIHVENSASLTVSGGTITENTAVNGGGIYNDGGTATVQGSAKLQNNTTSWNDGDTSNTGNGAGIYLNAGTLTVEGNAEISGNIAEGRGGAMYTAGGTATIQGNCELKDNRAYNDEGGAGVYLYNATLTMSGGTISGNKVVKSAADSTVHGTGGGVRLANGNVTFTMSGGTISGNEAGKGAGVYLANNDTTFNMSGGSIINNIARASEIGGVGGGVDIMDGSNTVKLNFSGTAIISGNKGMVGNTEVTKNLVLDHNTNILINVTDALKKAGVNGDTVSANIGVYVTDKVVIDAEGEDPAVTQYDLHGAAGTPFGTFTNEANLDSFVNDRNNLKGTKSDQDANDKKIYWADAPAYIKLENKSSQNPLYFKIIIDDGKYGESIYKRGSQNQSPIKPSVNAGNYYYLYEVAGISAEKQGASETLYFPRGAGLTYRVELYADKDMKQQINTLAEKNIIEGVKEGSNPEKFRDTDKAFTGTLKEGPKYQIRVGGSDSAPVYKYSPEKLTEPSKINAYNDNKSWSGNSYNAATADPEKHTYIYLVDAGFDVSFLKVDGFGNLLPGATFTLYEDANCTKARQKNNADMTATSSAKKENLGIVYFEKATMGISFMKETTIPTKDAAGKDAAYKNDNTYIVLVGDTALKRPASPVAGSIWASGGVLADITQADITAQTGTGDDAKKFAIFLIQDGKAVTTPDIAANGIMNESAARRKVILRKVNDSNSSLEGAQFRIFKADFTEVTDDQPQGKNYYESYASGLYFVGELSEGKYYLVETQAPTKERGIVTTDYKGNKGKVFELTVNENGGTVPQEEKGSIQVDSGAELVKNLKTLVNTSASESTESGD